MNMKPSFKVFSKQLKPLYLIPAFILLCSHNLYLKMESYFLKPNQEATLSLYNGTFEKSDNIITRDRMLDASLVLQGKRLNIDESQWADKDSTVTEFTFTPIEAGTYVAGVSTKARNIELTAEKFNKYLKHDGVLDILEQRTANNLLDQDAVESYEKHVKAIYQVGDVKTDDWKTTLGYPIEFVPQANPYEKHTGETLEVQLLLDGKPLSNQLVYADYIETDHTHTHDGHSHAHHDKKHSHDGNAEHTHKDHDEEHTHDHEHEHEHNDHTHKHDEEAHTHEHEHDGKKHSHGHTHDNEKHHDNKHDRHDETPKSEEEHTHTSDQQLRTNDQGIVTVNLPKDGIYYLRTIHMVNVVDTDELTHQSKWATLTFEVTHKHDSSTHTHDDHEHSDGIPTWVFILGSVLVIGVLFFMFRQKK